MLSHAEEPLDTWPGWERMGLLVVPARSSSLFPRFGGEKRAAKTPGRCWRPSSCAKIASGLSPKPPESNHKAHVVCCLGMPAQGLKDSGGLVKYRLLSIVEPFRGLRVRDANEEV